MSREIPRARLQPDDVVATVRGKAITYRMIRCHAEIDVHTAKSMNDHRPVEEICADAERIGLRHRLEVALIEAAAEICHIVPSDEQLRAALPVVFDEESIARSVRLTRAKARVVEGASRGEDAAKLIDELLVPLGVTRQAFTDEMPYWTAEGAETVLTTDYATVVRSQRMHDATVAAVRTILAAEHRGDDEGRRRFWEEIIRSTNTTVRDGFAPPDWRQLP
jgi:hypothetical protein